MICVKLQLNIIMLSVDSAIDYQFALTISPLMVIIVKTKNLWSFLTAYVFSYIVSIECSP